MSADRRDTVLVIVQLAVLLAVVGLVDPVLIRVGMTLAIALLLVQRGLRATSAMPKDDRRQDGVTREAIDRLLVRTREFYSACSLARRGQIPVERAEERIRAIEKDLNAMLDDVIRISRGEAAPAAAPAH